MKRVIAAECGSSGKTYYSTPDHMMTAQTEHAVDVNTLEQWSIDGRLRTLRKPFNNWKNVRIEEVPDTASTD